MQTYHDWSPTQFDSHISAETLDGESVESWLVAPVILTRDSGVRETSNYHSTARAIKAVSPDGADYMSLFFRHWGPGWFEILVVRPESLAARIADDIESGLADYPVVDDEDYSAREMEDAQNNWVHTSLRERIKLCTNDRVSIFAARHDWIPQSDSGRIFDAMRSDS